MPAFATSELVLSACVSAQETKGERGRCLFPPLLTPTHCYEAPLISVVVSVTVAIVVTPLVVTVAITVPPEPAAPAIFLSAAQFGPLPLGLPAEKAVAVDIALEIPLFLTDTRVTTAVPIIRSCRGGA